MLERLRELRSRYFQDMVDPLIELQPPAGHAMLTDTNAVETEAAVAAAGEGLDPEVRAAVLDLYRRCLARYEYVKEANEKFLAMLEEGLMTDLSDPAQQEQIHRFAESLMLDPVDQPMTYAQYEAEDLVDEAQELTQVEAVLYGDKENVDSPRNERFDT